AIFKQAVEHAPDKRPMRAAALKGKIHVFHGQCFTLFDHLAGSGAERRHLAEIVHISILKPILRFSFSPQLWHMGCGQHPTFPAPSVSRTTVDARLRTLHAARMRSRSSAE
ncbi:MAG TPA: hypothetical protein VHJ00_03745, partial [Bradyrhizobium sp.]|nr:hypothetical protein [Bradyrhizobium sp.]